ncbi:MAG: hypothetical protein IPK77_09065 [Cellvibrio sp.]|nr:hypothetical protein [Cellvibrio sp.]
MYTYLAALALVIVIALAAYSFLNHSIEKRRIRHKQLVTALRARRNSFRDLATGFPSGFLSNDLTTLLYRSIIDCCDQLTRLEPKDQTHTDQLAHYTTQLNELKNQPKLPRPRLENPQQIREARQLLQELMKYVVQQGQLNIINPVQTEAYVDQIKRLVLHMAIDGHLINAKQSQAAGKIKLAIHHYGLAKKAMIGENTTNSFDKQIGQLDALIKKLEEKLGAPEQEQTSSEATLPNKEWEKLQPADKDQWKRKNLYD